MSCSANSVDTYSSVLFKPADKDSIPLQEARDETNVFVLEGKAAKLIPVDFLAAQKLLKLVVSPCPRVHS